MNNISRKMLKEWAKERDEVVKTYDVTRFKEFYKKWQIKGIYEKQINTPPDNVIEISMRKMVYHMDSATPEEKKAAEKWLKDHGSSTNL